MIRKPKITIITITKNEAATLRNALDSVAAQSWPNVEHLVVIGDSNDGSAEILAEYPSVRVLSDEGKGLWHALNVGLKAATGDIIGLVHGNDRLAGPYVLHQVAEAFIDPKVGFTYADIVYRHAAPEAKIKRTYSAHRFHPDMLRYGYAPPHPSLYIRRELAREIGPYAEDFIIGSDFEYWLRLFASGAGYRYLPIVVAEMTPGGLSSKWRHRLYTSFAEKWIALGRNGYRRRPQWLLGRMLFLFDRTKK